MFQIYPKFYAEFDCQSREYIPIYTLLNVHIYICTYKIICMKIFIFKRLKSCYVNDSR